MRYEQNCANLAIFKHILLNINIQRTVVLMTIFPVCGKNLNKPY